MAKDKYDFIQELLGNKKLTPAQKERVLLLTSAEIRKDKEAGGLLEDRVIKNEESINVINNNVSKIENDITEINNKNLERGKLETEIIKKRYIGQHDPVQTFEILKSLKFNDQKYSFKFLVHDFPLSSPTDFVEKVQLARADYQSLQNVPYELYKMLDAIITSYEIYGKDIVVKYNVHPFSFTEDVIIKDEDIDKLSPLFGGGSPYRKNHFKKFSTAIQNFKKKYRFELEKTEASILEDFLRNITLYEKHDDNNFNYSFSKKVSTDLFNITQIEFDLKVNSFFVWNPSLRLLIKWIVSGILKHSNVKGNRDFSPDKKRIKYSTYEAYDPINNRDLIVFDIIDKNSYITKDHNDFIKNVNDQINETNMTSVSDVEVYFNNDVGQGYFCSILPKGQLEIKTEWQDGLLYRFKLIKDIK